ncbi:hypothetical protein K6U49_08500 [Vibrio alginolyticus]|uniref:hypothetical protein n=1 Tax=Vibrio alginolyticus TaxID=663 RepID=UPI001EE9CF9E|nr:hypothetical protein [Vibrio alginolyticus]MCG6308634.1 hypothetical protein [Vibrio alginolyticus]
MKKFKILPLIMVMLTPLALATESHKEEARSYLQVGWDHCHEAGEALKANNPHVKSLKITLRGRTSNYQAQCDYYLKTETHWQRGLLSYDSETGKYEFFKGSNMSTGELKQ